MMKIQHQLKSTNDTSKERQIEVLTIQIYSILYSILQQCLQ